MPHVVKWRSRAQLFVVVLVAAMTVGAATATAKTLKEGSRGADVVELQRALGVPADGVFGPQTKRAVKRHQRRHDLVVDGIAGPATLASLGLTDQARSTKSTSVADVLERIAQCESGGDPTAVSPDGRYRGKYQFSRETRKSLGGKGDPAKAPEARQDRLARKLYLQAGSAPWPNCA